MKRRPRRSQRSGEAAPSKSSASKSTQSPDDRAKSNETAGRSDGRPDEASGSADARPTKLATRRKFYWTQHLESGFPNRVNHAVAVSGGQLVRCGHGPCSSEGSGSEAAFVTDRGPSCKLARATAVYSLGGYHADDDKRTVMEADTRGGPVFRSSPIDVYCLDPETRRWCEEKPPPAEMNFVPRPHPRAPVPPCRYGHTVCEYQGKVYMYGGRNDEDGSFSKVECYDTVQKVWLNIVPIGAPPSSRDGHACTAIGPEMFIHGGFSANDIKFSSDLYAFHMGTHTWRLLPNEGKRISERDFHTATAVNNKIVVFGGRSDHYAPYFTANDVYDNVFYSYDLEQSKWSSLNTHGYAVEGRRSHSAVCYTKDAIIFFGGYNGKTRKHFGDVFILDTESMLITEIKPFGYGPLPRRRVGCCLVNSEMIMFGGTSPVEQEREGKKSMILHDHNDMYILHLVPTLEQLCVMSVIQLGLDTSSLPVFLQQQVKFLIEHADQQSR